jgi:plastocyanin
MSRKPLALAAGLVAVGLTLAIPAMARPTATPLAGTVGPGFTITLDKGGKKVTSLKPGAYKITVNDKAKIHDFHLFGPGVNKVITSVPFSGTKSVTVTLKNGTYTYQCDPHASSGMKATFKVGAPAAAAATSTTTTTPAPSTTDTTTDPMMTTPGYGY